MRTGEFIYALTHAEFLNKVFGTNYKGYMKCTWRYDDNKTVWMVRFNEQNGGWTNKLLSPNRIVEENRDAGRLPTKNTTVRDIDKVKIVIEIMGQGYNRRYVFRGVFKYDEINSNSETIRYYDKIADEI